MAIHQLATAKLSLDIYRNDERLSAVPPPMTITSTKHSSIEKYFFQLVLHTTAVTFPSNLLRVRAYTMSVCFGNVQDPVLLENTRLGLPEMGAT